MESRGPTDNWLNNSINGWADGSSWRVGIVMGVAVLIFAAAAVLKIVF